MSEQTVKATIIQTAPSGAPYDVSITLEDKASGIQFCEIHMSLEEFGRMMHAPTHAKCEVVLRGLDHVGWDYEVKEDVVPYASHGKDQEAISAALAQFEVDGWKGRTSDLGNMHRRSGDGYRVTFRRFVPPKEQP